MHENFNPLIIMEELLETKNGIKLKDCAINPGYVISIKQNHELSVSYKLNCSTIELSDKTVIVVVGTVEQITKKFNSKRKFILNG